MPRINIARSNIVAVARSRAKRTCEILLELPFKFLIRNNCGSY